MSRKIYRRVMTAAVIVAAIAALRFSIVGAWPVALFFVADVAALWLGFYLYRQACRRYEVISLSPTMLSLTSVSAGGRKTSWFFEPYWARIELVSSRHNEQSLTIRSKDQIKKFGEFLNPPDQKSAALELNEKLALWRAGNL